MKRAFLLAVKLGVLCALVALAAATQNLGEIWALIAGTNFIYLLIFFLLNVTAVALASSNLYFLLRPLGKGLPWRRLFYFDLLSLVGSYYTPGGVGGLGVVVSMMNRDGVGLKDSAVAVLADKAVTLVVAVLFLAVYVFTYQRGTLTVQWRGLSALALLAALVVVALIASPWIRQSAKKIIVRSRCYSGHYRLFTINILITIMVFSLSALQFIVAFAAIGIQVTDWLLILVSYGALLMVNYLPITFGGIGLGEAVAIFLWARLGATSEQILAAFLVVRLFTLASALLLSGGAAVVWSLERRTSDTEQKRQQKE